MYSGVFLAIVVILLSTIPTSAFRLNSVSRFGKNLLSKTVLGATTADFKNGMTFEIDGVPVRLMEFLHVKPGKGSAFVRTKIKNLTNGSVQERTFRAGESIQLAEVTKTDMQYTYTDGNSICFMNMETFEEERIDKSMISNEKLLLEGLSCQVSVFNGKVIDVVLPQQVTYTVAETAPNFKGNTATGGQKPATLNSGAVVNVPMFIEVGEKIVVSTADCKYISRA
eukprot:gene7454-8241_t